MFTPGPWMTSETNDGGLDVWQREPNGRAGSYVAHVGPGNRMTEGDCQANARLIAAAPTLWGVAKMVTLLGPSDPGVEALKDQARAAVAGIEGQDAS